jgi:hypothetical protein
MNVTVNEVREMFTKLRELHKFREGKSWRKQDSREAAQITRDLDHMLLMMEGTNEAAVLSRFQLRDSTHDTGRVAEGFTTFVTSMEASDVLVVRFIVPIRIHPRVANTVVVYPERYPDPGR